MKKPIKTICKYRSDRETEVYIGSGFCRRCPYFNGIVNKKEISCLIPKI